ncbi:MAG: hypothetical protein HY725_12310 [Candidatus Rokubacteria bacterium]|nr:hypothetical protein [Candidatus Rokubacteria bacterium]
MRLTSGRVGKIALTGTLAVITGCFVVLPASREARAQTTELELQALKKAAEEAQAKVRAAYTELNDSEIEYLKARRQARKDYYDRHPDQKPKIDETTRHLTGETDKASEETRQAPEKAQKASEKAQQARRVADRIRRDSEQYPKNEEYKKAAEDAEAEAKRAEAEADAVRKNAAGAKVKELDRLRDEQDHFRLRIPNEERDEAEKEASEQAWQKVLEANKRAGQAAEEDVRKWREYREALRAYEEPSIPPQSPGTGV